MYITWWDTVKQNSQGENIQGPVWPMELMTPESSLQTKNSIQRNEKCLLDASEESHSWTTTTGSCTRARRGLWGPAAVCCTEKEEEPRENSKKVEKLPELRCWAGSISQNLNRSFSYTSIIPFFNNPSLSPRRSWRSLRMRTGTLAILSSRWSTDDMERSALPMQRVTIRYACLHCLTLRCKWEEFSLSSYL